MAKEELNNIFGDLDVHLRELEEERKKKSDKNTYTWLVGLLLSFLFAFFCMILIPVAPFKFFLPVVFLILGITFTYYLSQILKKEFQNSFKEKIIQRLIKSHYPNFSYHPLKHISLQDFRNAKLFKRKPHHFSGEDWIEGKYEDTDFRLSELKATYESKDNDGHTTSNTIFDGLFMIADFHKYFHSRTYVIPETGWKAIGLNKKKHAGASLIEMEDPEFERRFRVFSTNDQDARYILSPAMMERICKLQDKFKGDLHISFRGATMNIAISNNLDFFEHDINKPLYPRSPVKEHIDDLKAIIGIMDDLSLNTRIWSKIPIRLLADEDEEVD